MDSRNQQYLFEKIWDPKFSEFGKVVDEKLLVDLKEELNICIDNLLRFSADFVDTTPQTEIELLEGFCQDTSLEDVKLRKSDAGSRRGIWVDDRSTIDLDLIGGGNARQHENPLTATGLLWALKEPRYNHEKLPDAARRLIYVTDLDPACIHALAATAHIHQVPALRNAIYNYLALQPSIEVTLPSAGFLNFQLDLHLPLFLLRCSTPPESGIKVNSKPPRQWTNLSFLKLDTPKWQRQEPGEVWGMHEAEFSYVVTGSDEWRWVGYAFVDTGLDGLLTDASDLDLGFDQVAAGEIEARRPFWRPRDHWVKVLDIRIEQVRREWEFLVYKLGLAVNRYMKDHPSTLSRRPGVAQDRTTELKEAFDWALQMLNLLRRLDAVLSATVKAWQSFASPGGDIGYFHDSCADAVAKTKSVKARYQSLQNVHAKFRRLERYQAAIAVLIRSCEEYQVNLKLRLNLDEKESADQNEFTSAFTILVFYPVALAASIFSMQQEAIPFKQSPRSFVITIFFLIVIVYLTLLAGKYALPPLTRKMIALCVREREEAGGVGKILVEDEVGDSQPQQPMKGLDLGKPLRDEEDAIPNYSPERVRSCGTRALLGPTVGGQEAQLGR